MSPGLQRPAEGKIVEIAVYPDGKIRVRRAARDPEGPQDIERVYDGPEELKRKDPAAFEAFLRMRGEPPPPKMEEGRWRREIEQLTQELTRAMEEARRQLEDLGSRDHQRRRELTEHLRQYQKKIQDKIHQTLREYEQRLARRFEHLESKGPAPHDSVRFEVDLDGVIRVAVRKGADELVLTFPNEDELKRRKPGLHRKLLELRGDL